MKTWQKGAIIGFFFTPVWIWIGWFFMSILSLFGIEGVGEGFEAFFMLPLLPTIITRELLGLNLPVGLDFFLFWTLIGAVAGYFIEHRRIVSVKQGEEN